MDDKKTPKSFKDLRKPTKIVKSKKTTARLRNAAGLKKLGSVSDAVVTRKMQRRALASPAARAKPKSQVSLPKMPSLSIDKNKNKKPLKDAFDFKVNIDGFPEMFMSGNSPGEVKSHLRKLVKQPSMIQSVDRVTKHDKKKHHRDKVKESVEEGIKYTHAAIDKSGKVIGMASQESDAKDMARRNKGRVVKLKKPMSDKKGDMMINRPFKEAGMKRMSTGDGMDTFRKKPPEVKKANEKTSGKVDYGSDESIKIMKKKTPGEKNEQNRFTTMVLPSLKKAKDALARIGSRIMGQNPTGNQQRKKFTPGIRQNIRNKPS
tara:strand:+ start:556 stop:1509 length:954 start_codon:yes stop_codon:yes gene_type:complete